jgi:putative alpha-1,2-mannosidase
VKLNGKRHPRPWLRFGNIASGGNLAFDLAARPDHGFGAAPKHAPPSYSAPRPLNC